jgi:hypothetical protein
MATFTIHKIETTIPNGSVVECVDYDDYCGEYVEHEVSTDYGRTIIIFGHNKAWALYRKLVSQMRDREITHYNISIYRALVPEGSIIMGDSDIHSNLKWELLDETWEEPPMFYWQVEMTYPEYCNFENLKTFSNFCKACRPDRRSIRFVEDAEERISARIRWIKSMHRWIEYYTSSYDGRFDKYKSRMHRVTEEQYMALKALIVSEIRGALDEHPDSKTLTALAEKYIQKEVTE